jgi:putative phosphoesterase
VEYGPAGRFGAGARRNLERVTLVAVIADTHMPRGARRLPDSCLELLARADAILHAGDVTAASVLDELRELGPLQAVHGNMDEPALRATLPERLVAEVGGLRIGMLHDAGPRAGRAPRLAAAFPGCDAIVHGHTHLPEVTLHDGVWILNPGSPTERRSGPFRSMLVLELGAGGIEPRLVEL